VKIPMGERGDVSPLILHFIPFAATNETLAIQTPATKRLISTRVK
jgi:hypothetical protein